MCSWDGGCVWRLESVLGMFMTKTGYPTESRTQQHSQTGWSMNASNLMSPVLGLQMGTRIAEFYVILGTKPRSSTAPSPKPQFL